MKILVDMNISPQIADMLTAKCIECKHWCKIGEYNAKDSEIMEYALQNNYSILTCDLDFSALLSASHGKKPSIIQVRVNSLPLHDLAELLATSVKKNSEALIQGAILTIDVKRNRIRLLPLHQK